MFLQVLVFFSTNTVNIRQVGKYSELSISNMENSQITNQSVHQGGFYYQLMCLCFYRMGKVILTGVSAIDRVKISELLTCLCGALGFVFRGFLLTLLSWLLVFSRHYTPLITHSPCQNLISILSCGCL